MSAAKSVVIAGLCFVGFSGILAIGIGFALYDGASRLVDRVW